MLERISDEVYYLRGDIRVVDHPLFNFLETAAKENPRQRCRICLHDNPAAPIHEMIIAHRKNVFVPPHVHLDQAETFTILSGLATLHLLNESGRLLHSIPLGDIHSQRSTCINIPKGQWHTQSFESEVVIFYEVTSGPFSPKRSRNLWDVDGPEHEKHMREFLNTLAQAQ